MSEIIFLGDHYLKHISDVKDWINLIVERASFVVENLTYQFVDDSKMIQVNRKFLNHDNYTDIITFDYTEGAKLSADIFISTERVLENAEKFDLTYENEMMRVLIHGVLHCLGYSDKTQEEKQMMRKKENESLELFHVEHKI